MEAVTLQIWEKGSVLGEYSLIFVTVGNHYQAFERLISKMDEIAGKIDEQVIMQVGYTAYKPVNAQYFDFAGYSKIKQLNNDARIVVSHAGVGSILTALGQKTHLIIVPRLKKYYEVVDDHQLEIAKAMSDDKNVTVLYDPGSLEDCLKLNFDFVEGFNDNKLVYRLKSYISSISI